MKNWIVLALFTLIGAISFAQKADDLEFVPKEGDAGIVFNVAGLISNIQVAPVQDPMGNNIILGKYYVRNNHVVRLGLGMKSFNNSYNLVDSLGSAKRSVDSTFKKFNMYLSPAYEFHLRPNKRLDPYIGAGLNFGLLGKTKQQIDVELTDTTGTDKQQITYTKDGGFMFGINALVGFNYYIAPQLALGLEYNLGYYFSRDGGDWERVTVTSPVSGQSTSRRELGSERLANSGFDHSNNLSINISYYFGVKNNSKTTRQ